MGQSLRALPVGVTMQRGTTRNGMDDCRLSQAPILGKMMITDRAHREYGCLAWRRFASRCHQNRRADGSENHPSHRCGRRGLFVGHSERGMGPGGVLWRVDDAAPWSSLEAPSAWGAERLTWPARWSLGFGKAGPEDCRFLGENLAVSVLVPTS